MTRKELLLVLLWSPNLYAWQHEVLIGYGYGQEVEQAHANSGIVIASKLYKFPKIDETLIASIDGTVTKLHANSKRHRHLATAAIAVAFRAYFSNPDLHHIKPYLQASFGPAYQSANTLGNRTQGRHLSFQSAFEMGSEFGTTHNWDINLRMMHFCNAGLFHPNEGINLLPILSLGYQF